MYMAHHNQLTIMLIFLPIVIIIIILCYAAVLEILSYYGQEQKIVLST